MYSGPFVRQQVSETARNRQIQREKTSRALEACHRTLISMGQTKLSYATTCFQTSKRICSAKQFRFRVQFYLQCFWSVNRTIVLCFTMHDASAAAAILIARLCIRCSTDLCLGSFARSESGSSLKSLMKGSYKIHCKVDRWEANLANHRHVFLKDELMLSKLSSWAHYSTEVNSKTCSQKTPSHLAVDDQG